MQWLKAELGYRLELYRNSAVLRRQISITGNYNE